MISFRNKTNGAGPSSAFELEWLQLKKVAWLTFFSQFIVVQIFQKSFVDDFDTVVSQPALSEKGRSEKRKKD